MVELGFPPPLRPAAHLLAAVAGARAWIAVGGRQAG